MKNWVKGIVASTLVAAQLIAIPTVSASSLENIQNEKQAVEETVNQLQGDLNVGLEEVSEISIALDELNKEIEEHKNTIVETEAEIVEQEELVEARYEHTAEQLQAMQTSELNHNIVLNLLQAETITDFFNTLITATRLTDASSQHLEEAQTEYQKLETLKEELVNEKTALDEKQVKVVEQKEALDTKVAALRTTIASNQAELEQLNEKEAQIHQEIAEREAAEKAAAEKAATEKAAAEKQKASVSIASSNQASASNENAKSNSNNSDDSNRSNDNANQKEAAPKENNNNAGSWFSVQATGYSTQQAGLSTRTATGINLLANPRVIAVDPSVIPLGSLVEVQGMGVYVAGDTGGAINGRIIDIHFSTVGQALNWGRRNVNVRIIN